MRSAAPSTASKSTLSWGPTWRSAASRCSLPSRSRRAPTSGSGSARKAKRPPKPERAERGSPGRSASSRAARCRSCSAPALAVNVPGAAYLVGLKDIAAGDHSAVAEIALIVTFNLIMFLLAEIPLIGLILAPERTDRLVAEHGPLAVGQRPPDRDRDLRRVRCVPGGARDPQRLTERAWPCRGSALDVTLRRRPGGLRTAPLRMSPFESMAHSIRRQQARWRG